MHGKVPCHPVLDAQHQEGNKRKSRRHAGVIRNLGPIAAVENFRIAQVKRDERRGQCPYEIADGQVNALTAKRGG